MSIEQIHKKLIENWISQTTDAHNNYEAFLDLKFVSKI